MHQFDILYMPSDTLYGNKYKYILSGIDAASRYKVAGPMRTKQAKDVAEMIADIYKVGPPTFPKIFQCDNGSEFKGEVTKLLEKHEVKIRRVTTKYNHTHTAFVEALNKVLAEQLLKVQDAQELNDPKKISSTWVKHLYGIVERLNDTKTQMTGMKQKDAIELKKVPLLENYPLINEAIKKTRRKGGMILSMGFDRKKVNPLIYTKLWKQTCLPSLVFGSELWSLTKTDMACLECCQNWFIKKVFNLPKFSSHLLLIKISGLISVENEIAKKNLIFYAHMAFSTSDTVLCKLFQARVRSFLTIQNNSFGFIKNVVFLMHKYSLSDYFVNWTRNISFIF